jgi:hypothetical protein
MAATDTDPVDLVLDSLALADEMLKATQALFTAVAKGATLTREQAVTAAKVCIVGRARIAERVALYKAVNEQVSRERMS